jgi:hypothetical protein
MLLEVEGVQGTKIEGRDIAGSNDEGANLAP